MAIRPFTTATLSVPNGTVTPTLESINSDPSVTGHTSPLGSLLMRTDSPGLYFKSGAGNTAWTRLVATNQNLVKVNYVGTGAEGTDFQVPIGQTLPTDIYEVYWSPKGVAQIPAIDMPDTLVADRTTTTFRVITTATLTAGDTLAFLIFQP